MLRGARQDVPALRASAEALLAAVGRAEAPRALVVHRGLSAEEIRTILAAGAEGAFPAFVSTSIDRDIAREFARRRNGRLIEIRIAAGTRGVAYIHPWPHTRPAQFEVLLAPGTRYRVVGRTNRRVVLEIAHVRNHRSGG